MHLRADKREFLHSLFLHHHSWPSDIYPQFSFHLDTELFLIGMAFFYLGKYRKSANFNLLGFAFI